MLADEGLVAARQAERGLELAARAQHAGQIRAPGFGQHHRAGHIAACPAVEKGRRGGFFPVGGQGTHTGHAVVHAHQDVTVVQQPGISKMLRILSMWRIRHIVLRIQNLAHASMARICIFRTAWL